MKYRLVEHNSKEQKMFGGCDDTRDCLKVGQIYEGKAEVHSWHTKIIIDGKKYNSVCFREVERD